MLGLSKIEITTLKNLSTPIKIQNFLDKLPMSWEKKGETYMSPRRVLQENKAHCMEGSMLAAAALLLHGEPPLLFDLWTDEGDDHVVALYKRHGYWGAISKTNHAALRFRDPVYKTLRELALSYFHEYFDNKTGKKMLRKYSAEPFDLRKYGSTDWLTAEENLSYIAKAIDKAPHRSLVPKKNVHLIRPADAMEIRAGRVVEWKKTDRRT